MKREHYDKPETIGDLLIIFLEINELYEQFKFEIDDSPASKISFINMLEKASKKRLENIFEDGIVLNYNKTLTFVDWGEVEVKWKEFLGRIRKGSVPSKKTIFTPLKKLMKNIVPYNTSNISLSLDDEIKNRELSNSYIIGDFIPLDTSEVNRKIKEETEIQKEKFQEKPQIDLTKTKRKIIESLSDEECFLTQSELRKKLQSIKYFDEAFEELVALNFFDKQTSFKLNASHKIVLNESKHKRVEKSRY